jgi:hypothetical protein
MLQLGADRLFTPAVAMPFEQSVFDACGVSDVDSAFLSQFYGLERDYQFAANSAAFDISCVLSTFSSIMWILMAVVGCRLAETLHRSQGNPCFCSLNTHTCFHTSSSAAFFGVLASFV